MLRQPVVRFTPPNYVRDRHSSACHDGAIAGLHWPEPEPRNSYLVGVRPRIKTQPRGVSQ